MSMTNKECWAELQVIIQAFGAQNYTKPGLGLIWEKCQDLPLKAFQAICKDFLLRRMPTNPPLPDDFIEAAKAWRRVNKSAPPIDTTPWPSTKLDRKAMLQEFLKRPDPEWMRRRRA